jgi:hypothetical protein
MNPYCRSRFATYFFQADGGAPPAPVADPAAPPATPPAADPAAAPVGEPTLISDALKNPPVDPAAPPVDPTKLGDPKVQETPKIEPLKPEDYKLAETTLPEGIKADDPMVKGFLASAAEAGLNNDAVNAVLAKVAPSIAEQLNAPMKAYTALRDSWIAEVKADPVIGGQNTSLVAARISQGIQRMASEMAKTPAEAAKIVNDMSSALVVTGAGNNPSFIRVLNHVFGKLSEGTPVVGNPARPSANPGSVMYDHPSSQAASKT